MKTLHYLGVIPKIGETLWYVVTYETQRVALLSFSSAALKYAARDCWISWNYCDQAGQLKLLAKK